MDLHIDNAQRICMAGSTGSGKSVFFYAIANLLCRNGVKIFYYNTSREEKYKQYITHKNFISYMPPFEKARNLQHFELWLGHIRSTYHSYNEKVDGYMPENQREYYTVAVDDIDLLYNNYNYAKDMSETLKAHIGEGRKIGIGFIWLVKMLEYIPKTLFNNLSYIFVGRFNTNDTLSKLRSFASVNEILNIADQRFICVDLRPERKLDEQQRGVFKIEGGSICEKI